MEETMKKLNHLLARRTVIKGAGLGFVAGGLASALPTQSASAAASEGGEIWSSEYWAKKGDVKGDVPLWMYRKRLGAPKAGEPSRPVLFFVPCSAGNTQGIGLKCARPWRIFA